MQSLPSFRHPGNSQTSSNAILSTKHLSLGISGAHASPLTIGRDISAQYVDDAENLTGPVTLLNAINLPDSYVRLADRPKNKDGMKLRSTDIIEVSPIIQGFYSIEDFMMLGVGRNRESNNILDTMTVANQLDERLHTVGTIELAFGPDEKVYMYRHINPKTLDMKDIISLLVERGFVRVFCIVTGTQEWLLFNEKNVPIEKVNIFPESAGTSNPVMTGIVSIDLKAQLIKFIIPQLLPAEIIVTVEELKSFTEHGQPIFNTQVFDKDSKYAHPEFYPWIKMPLDQYFLEYFQSNANILVMMGDPGTGKSTLLRSVIRELNLAAMVAYKTEVIESPLFIPTCDDFLRRSLNSIPGQHRVVAVEDADNLMGRRTDGNKVMASILNASDGISSRKLKMIFSTNIKNINDIDPAMLRPGRCFDVLCFRNLTVDEACDARAAAGLEIRRFDEDGKSKTYSLAEVLNDVKVQDNIQQIVKPRFGFA